MVTSGYTGWKKRMERRKTEAGEQYRSAENTLKTRTRKKLTGREEWYKDKGEKRKREEDEEPRIWKKKRKEQGEITRGIKTISVMFVPHTKNGELAKKLREAEEEMGKQTGYKIKIVEKTGKRIVDMLHKSNPC